MYYIVLSVIALDLQFKNIDRKHYRPKKEKSILYTALWILYGILI